MRPSFYSALLATLLAHSAVYASDPMPIASQAPYMDETSLRPSFSWDGAYAGASVGYHRSSGTGHYNTTTDIVSGHGATIGAFVGYNAEVMPSVVVGLDAELGYDTTRAQTNSFGTILSGGLETSVRARLGYAMDRTLLYVAGGYTGATIKLNQGAFAANNWLNGWTIGAGADYAVTDQVFVRGEYRYSRFGAKDMSFANVNNHINLSRHTAKVGVGAKF